MEAIQQAAQLDEVLGVGRLAVELVEQAGKPPDLVLDLCVATAQSPGGVGAAKGAGDGGVEQLLLGPLVLTPGRVSSG